MTEELAKAKDALHRVNQALARLDEAVEMVRAAVAELKRNDGVTDARPNH
jgi:hypothetical protein